MLFVDINLRQLRMLREVAHRGTIAAAAESLGYTASAASQQLSALEKSTGVAVLERVGRNVRLTDAGRELVRHAGELFAGMEAAQAAVEQVSCVVRGELHLSTIESVSMTLLPSILKQVSRDHPELRLLSRQLDPDLALDALSLGEVDIAFVLRYPHSPAAPRPDIVREPVMEDRFLAVLHADDPLAQRSSLNLDEVRDHDFILPAGHFSCSRCVVMACRDASFEPRVVHRLDDYHTTLCLIAAGQGVGVLPELGLTSIPPGVRALPIEPPLSRTVEVAHRTTSADRPSVQAVLDAVRVAVDQRTDPCYVPPAASTSSR